MESASSACLGDEELLLYAEGGLDAKGRAACEEHFDSCAVCRSLASELAHRSTSVGAQAADRVFPPGTKVGRYVLVRCIGAGGIGVVYRAHDAELERFIALKIISVGTSSPEKRLREAKAMARVRHPNVVSIFDIGLHEGHFFIAMELVDGENAREWQERPARTFGQVISLYTDVARGLAAVHETGLVHADVKPDNILLDEGGRACVTDFGFAEFRDPGNTTGEGILGGTPAYTAAEVLQGASPNARSDQYSFCVSLHEALFGSRPSENLSLSEPEPGAETPWSTATRAERQRARRVLTRGLDRDPDARYPSMSDLIGDLVITPVRSRKRWILLGAAVGALLVLSGASYRARRAELSICDEVGADIGRVWSEPQRAAVRMQFGAVKKAYASKASEGVIARLDDYASDLRSASRRSCEASRIEKVQSEDSRALRSACFDRRKEELSALAGILTQPDADVVERALDLASRLTPVATCLDDSRLAAQPMPPQASEVEARVHGARAKLARGQLLFHAGKFDAALAIADESLGEATGIGYKPLEAEALLLHGVLLDRLGRANDARKSLYGAAHVAEVARYDVVAALAWAHLVWSVGYSQGDRAAGRALVEVAKIALARAGNRPDVAFQFELGAGALAAADGRYADARESTERAAAFARIAFGPDAPPTIRARHNQATLFAAEDRFATCIERASEVHGLLVRTQGRDHPLNVNALDISSHCHLALGRATEALRLGEEALRVAEEAYGKEHAVTTGAMLRVAEAKLAVGEVQEARGYAERADALRTSGRDAQRTRVKSQQVLARISLARGAAKEALDQIERADQLERKTRGERHPERVETLTLYARVLRELGRGTEALSRAEGAVALTDLGQHPRKLWEARVELGRIQRALGQAEKARATLLGAWEERLTIERAPENDAALAVALVEASKDAGHPADAEAFVVVAEDLLSRAGEGVDVGPLKARLRELR